MSVPMPPLPAGFGKMESVFLSKHAVRARDAAVARAALGEAARVCDEMAAQDKLSNYYAVAARAIRALKTTPNKG